MSDESQTAAQSPAEIAMRQSSDADSSPDNPLAIGNRYKLLVVFAVCYLLFSIFALLAPLPVRGRFWYRVADLLHIPAFAVLTFLALVVVRQHTKSSWRVPVLVTLCVVAFSGLMEIIQGLLSRYASLDDLFRNTLGAIAALLIFKSLEYWSSESARPRRLLMVGAVIVLAIATIRPTASIVDVYRQRMQFPALATFSSRSELQRWYISSAQVRRTPIKWLDGHYALKVEYLPGEFPAIQLQELERDWTEYRTLATELTHLPDSKSESIVIQLRIADRRARRDPKNGFVDRIVLKRGESVDWRFDLKAAQAAASGSGRLRMDEIQFVEFMAVNLAEPATVQYGRIRLEP